MDKLEHVTPPLSWSWIGSCRCKSSPRQMINHYYQ